MKKLTLVVTAILVLVLGVVSCASSTVPSEPTPTPTTGKKITLADAPVVLDLSPLLPARFEYLDAASEGFSKNDLGYGPDWSEVELFFSEEPYQVIYGILIIIESRMERAATDAVMKDDQQIVSMVTEGLRTTLAEEDMRLSDVDIQITHPSIGDVAALGQGYFSSVGMNVGYEMLWFGSNKVYVLIESVSLSAESEPLLPLAREIDHRIGMFSQ